MPSKVTHISGRRWFQKSYGNTCHTTTLHFDDGTSKLSPITWEFTDHANIKANDLAKKLFAAQSG
tara:strand:- start:7633 stop:7827 length:195 start_codon:yes stop_codon:yes gene_type:complete